MIFGVQEKVHEIKIYCVGKGFLKLSFFRNFVHTQKSLFHEKMCQFLTIEAEIWAIALPKGRGYY